MGAPQEIRAPLNNTWPKLLYSTVAKSPSITNPSNKRRKAVQLILHKLYLPIPSMRWLCNSTATGSKKKKIKSRGSDDIVEEASKGPVGRPTKKANKKKASISTIFQHADGIDLLLMAMGFLGAVGDGLCTPVMFLIMSRLMNSLGHGPSGLPSSFLQNINQVYILHTHT